MTAPATPPPVHMASTLHWFLIDLMARGYSLQTAETALRDAVTMQAAALRSTGIP
jgi:hypothetical protein